MIKIISDSTCDLTKDILEKYDISILPLHVILGDKDLLDGVTITPDEIYAQCHLDKIFLKKQLTYSWKCAAAFADFFSKSGPCN